MRDNSCECNLTVKGSAMEVANFLAVSTVASLLYGDRSLSFGILVPEPVDLSEEEEVEWRQRNWGTCSEILSLPYANEEGLICFRFETEDAPPTEWLDTAINTFTALEFTLEYETEDGDRGYMHGLETWLVNIKDLKSEPQEHKPEQTEYVFKSLADCVLLF